MRGGAATAETKHSNRSVLIFSCKHLQIENDDLQMLSEYVLFGCDICIKPFDGELFIEAITVDAGNCGIKRFS